MKHTRCMLTCCLRCRDGALDIFVLVLTAELIEDITWALHQHLVENMVGLLARRE